MKEGLVISPTARGFLSKQSLDRLVSEVMPNDIQPGEKITVLTVDDQGAKIAATMKFQPRPNVAVELQAAAHLDWTGDRGVGARVLMRWK